MDELKCHLCGEPAGRKFMLYVMTISDRPFVVHEKCGKQIDKAMKGELIPVERV
jgi:hypothetical protein